VTAEKADPTSHRIPGLQVETIDGLLSSYAKTNTSGLAIDAGGGPPRRSAR
jgi:hypothetical protein